MVYEDAEKLYSEVSRDGQALLEEAFSAIFPNTTAVNANSIPKAYGEIIAYNTTFFPRRDVVQVPLSGASHLRSQVVQVSKDGTTGYALLDCSDGGNVSRCSGLLNHRPCDVYVPRWNSSKESMTAEDLHKSSTYLEVQFAIPARR